MLHVEEQPPEVKWVIRGKNWKNNVKKECSMKHIITVKKKNVVFRIQWYEIPRKTSMYLCNGTHLHVNLGVNLLWFKQFS